MLAKTNRFHGYNSLNFAYKQGKAVRGSQLTLRFVLNEKRSAYRVAVVVSKKVSKSAVIRNRIRRRVYEAVRLQSAAIDKPYDIIIMVYAEEVATMPSEALQKAVTGLLQKASVI